MSKACAQCCQVKGHCSLVKKKDPAPSTPTKARKRPRVGEAGSTRTPEVREKGAEVAGKEESRGEGAYCAQGGVQGQGKCPTPQMTMPLGCY